MQWCWWPSETTNASLQRPLNDQILTFEAVKKFCSMIKGITFFSVNKDDLASICLQLNKCCKLGSTVKGTRSCHHFEPQSVTIIHAKHLIAEKDSITHSFAASDSDNRNMLIESLKPNDYIMCIYGDHWWLALVSQINSEEKVVLCNFLFPHGYTENFYWTQREDQVHVPFFKILLKTGPPKTLSNSGRQ